MTPPSPATPDTDLDLWLAQQTDKGLLRFLTCGSVDDGKSTLIGRLLYDSQLILDDQLASPPQGEQEPHVGDEGIDFSLLVDGLTAEREQGITIDVAYRFFSTDKRKFIVADTPGHEQYTRNMATGASQRRPRAGADRRAQGRPHPDPPPQLHPQPDRREARRPRGQQDRPRRLRRRRLHARSRPTTAPSPRPSASRRCRRSRSRPSRATTSSTPAPHTPWYQRPAARALPRDHRGRRPTASAQPMRFPVQWVNRPNLDFRGFSGTVASGVVKVGDDVLVAASRKPAKVTRIVTMDGDQQRSHRRARR